MYKCINERSEKYPNQNPTAKKKMNTIWIQLHTLWYGSILFIFFIIFNVTVTFSQLSSWRYFFVTHRMLLAFIMIPLMQRELDTFKDTIWNSHRIRPQKDAVLPSGIPDHIYSFPEEYGLEQSGSLWFWDFDN